MSEKKRPWTAGPLEVDLEDWTPGDDLTISCCGAPLVAVYGYNHFPCFDDDDEELVEVFNERQRAEATLYAAAPDLFEELFASTCWSCGHSYGSQEPEAVQCGSHSHARCRLALSKALGEKGEGK